jgi:hypothetical protein
MERECYAFIWGIMHFRQFLNQTFFVLKTNHKPLKWLRFILDANRQRGSWISMLQDFHFKIIHKLGNKHAYVDALNYNPICTSNEEDFQAKILDQSTFLPLLNQNCVAVVFIPLEVGVGEVPNKSS